MVKSIWIVEVDEYDYFAGNDVRQKRFLSLKEAFAYYKKEKGYDMEWVGDHTHDTKIFHIFVYENEEKIRQEKIREEKKAQEEKKRREEAQKAWEEEWQKREDEIRRILHPEHVEGEYLFDDGENPFEDLSDERFDGVAFNGLVDGAGEFPLWEKDSHK